MFEWADSNLLRAGCYVLVAVLALYQAWRDDRGRRGSWRWFWILTACLFVVMAIGRVGHVADFVTDQFRDRAEAEGWYADRRRVQAGLVVAFGVVWVVVLAASLRVPGNRRRYLPMVAVVFTIVVYAAIRVVSLHHVDVVLYEREFEGAPLGALVEWCLLLAAIACVLAVPRRRSSGRSGEPAGRDGAIDEFDTVALAEPVDRPRQPFA